MPSKNTSTAPRTNTQASKGPVTKFRLGYIQAAVWENTANGKTFCNVTFTRSYKDEQGNYHNSDSFRRDDLPRVAKLADLAHTFIFNRRAGKDDASQSEE